MFIKISRFKIATILLLCLSLYATPTHAISSVNVLADSNLGLALAQIARQYVQEKNTVINTSLAPLAAQQEQISGGGAADLVITPNQAWLDTLKTQGLIDIYSLSPVVRDQLVLVGPADSSLMMNLNEGFATAPMINELGLEPGFVIGNPETRPEGAFSKEALRSMDAASYLEPYTLYIKQFDEMLLMVQDHHSYGIFFKSSVANTPGIRIIDTFPEHTHDPIQYSAAVVAGENMDSARKFLDYLKSPPAQVIFEQYGFSATVQ